MKLMTLISMVVLTTGSLALADVSQDLYRCNEATSNVAIKECVSGIFEREDARLNVSYQAAMKRQPDAEARALLRRAERAWISFQDAQCIFEGDSMRGGTGRGLVEISCRLQLTSARADQLGLL